MNVHSEGVVFLKKKHAFSLSVLETFKQDFVLFACLQVSCYTLQILASENTCKRKSFIVTTVLIDIRLFFQIT